jgi:hypothetical protein
VDCSVLPEGSQQALAVVLPVEVTSANAAWECLAHVKVRSDAGGSQAVALVVPDIDLLEGALHVIDGSVDGDVVDASLVISRSRWKGDVHPSLQNGAW